MRSLASTEECGVFDGEHEGGTLDLGLIAKESANTQHLIQTRFGTVLTGGSNGSCGISANGLCTLCWGAGEIEGDTPSFLVFTVLVVLRGGEGGVCTRVVEVVEAELEAWGGIDDGP